MLVELRVRDLGVIESVTLDLGPGHDGAHGRDRGGQDAPRRGPRAARGRAGRPRPGAPRGQRGPGRGPLRRRRRGGHPGPGRPRPGTLAGLGRRPHGPGVGPGRGGGPAARPPRPARPPVAARRPAQRRALDAFAAHRPRTARPRPGPAAGGLRAELEALGGDDRARAREADLLRYQLAEIDAADLDGPDEDDRARPPRRSAWPKPARTATPPPRALAALDGGDGDRRAAAASSTCLGAARAALTAGRPLARAGRRAWRRCRPTPPTSPSELRAVVETWEDDPERLEEVRARRQLLRDLARKYGEGVGRRPRLRRRGPSPRWPSSTRPRSGPRSSQGELDAAEAEVAAAEAVVGAARRRAPRRARPAPWRSACGRLAMPHARIEVTVGERRPRRRRHLPPRAPTRARRCCPWPRWRRGASWPGPCWRCAWCSTDAPPTMVFDEVDAGVGGEAALAVGQRPGRGGPAPPGPGGHPPGPGGRVRPAASSACARSVAEGSDRGRCRQRSHGDDRVVELARMLSGQPRVGDGPAPRRRAARARTQARA